VPKNTRNIGLFLVLIAVLAAALFAGSKVASRAQGEGQSPQPVKQQAVATTSSAAAPTQAKFEIDVAALSTISARTTPSVVEIIGEMSDADKQATQSMIEKMILAVASGDYQAHPDAYKDIAAPEDGKSINHYCPESNAHRKIEISGIHFGAVKHVQPSDHSPAYVGMGVSLVYKLYGEDGAVTEHGTANVLLKQTSAGWRIAYMDVYGKQ